MKTSDWLFDDCKEHHLEEERDHQEENTQLDDHLEITREDLGEGQENEGNIEVDYLILEIALEGDDQAGLGLSTKWLIDKVPSSED